MTPSNVWMFAHDSYVHNNPRFGQILTLVVYTPGPWHAIFTPVVELSLVYVLTLMALGRRPSFQRTDDALMFATIFGMIALTAPLIGQLLFYRPFTGNYLFVCIGLAVLVPYHLHAATPQPRRWWWIAIMLVGGAIAGLCNEHTGPATVAYRVRDPGVLATRRAADGLMIAGLVGVIAGGLALYFAPGQDVRYRRAPTRGGARACGRARTCGACRRRNIPAPSTTTEPCASMRSCAIGPASSPIITNSVP